MSLNRIYFAKFENINNGLIPFQIPPSRFRMQRYVIQFNQCNENRYIDYCNGQIRE